MEEINSVNRPRRTPSLPFGGLRKFLCIAAVSIVATAGFQSVASAQYLTGYSNDECAGAFEQSGLPALNYLNYIPDADGCVITEGNPLPAPLIVLNASAQDPGTGESLGLVKDLDPDLSGGENSTTFQEMCGAFPLYTGLTAQQYFDGGDQYLPGANSKEQAILDPDSDGLACADEDEAFLSGDVGEPSGEDDPCENPIGGLVYVPAVNGCLTVETIYALPGIINGPVYDADAVKELLEDDTGTVVAPWDAGEELGILKDLVDVDDMYEQIGLDVSFADFCGDFPTTDIEGYEVYGISLAGLTAQEYHDQLANEKEQSILDPDGDGLACTSDDEAFLSGGFDDYDASLFEDTWDGVVTQTSESGNVLEFGIEADLIPLSDISESLLGEVIAEVEYDDVGCYGVWVLTEVGEESLAVEERLEGAENCVASTGITLTANPDGSLDYYFLDSLGSVGECTLTLRGGGGGSGDHDENPFDHAMSGLVTQTAEDGAESEFWVEVEIVPFSEITGDLIGEVIGEVELLGLDCGGVWVLEKVNDNSIVVEERITEGDTGNCVESVPITLTPKDDGTIEYYYLDSYGSVGRCVLTSRSTIVPDDDDGRKPSERMRELGMNELPDTGGFPLFAPLGGLLLAVGVLGIATIAKRRAR